MGFMDNISAFTNDAGYAKEADINNDLSENYAKKTDIPTNISHFTNDAKYITEANMPTNVSHFTNDAGYITSSGTEKIIGIEIVDELPPVEEQIQGILYIVKA
jgi:hypothetical protein